MSNKILECFELTPDLLKTHTRVELFSSKGSDVPAIVVQQYGNSVVCRVNGSVHSEIGALRLYK